MAALIGFVLGGLFGFGAAAFLTAGKAHADGEKSGLQQARSSSGDYNKGKEHGRNEALAEEVAGCR